MKDMEELKRDGYFVMRQAVDTGVLESVRQSISDFADTQIQELFSAGVIGDPHEEAPFETRWALVSRENDLQSGEHRVRQWGALSGLFAQSIYDLAVSSRLIEVIAPYIGPEIRAHGDYWIRPKVPGDPHTTLAWHQDSNYYGGKTSSGMEVLTVWIPLVDVDENNGCMKVVRGSNQHGSIEARRNELSQMESAGDVSKFGTITNVPMDVGDILVFTNLTLHASGNNSSDHVRWSIDLRYSSNDRPPDWHKLGEKIDTDFPSFIAHSEDPTKIMSFAQWQEKW